MNHTRLLELGEEAIEVRPLLVVPFFDESGISRGGDGRGVMREVNRDLPQISTCGSNGSECYEDLVRSVFGQNTTSLSSVVPGKSTKAVHRSLVQTED